MILLQQTKFSMKPVSTIWSLSQFLTCPSSLLNHGNNLLMQDISSSCSIRTSEPRVTGLPTQHGGTICLIWEPGFSLQSILVLSSCQRQKIHCVGLLSWCPWLAVMTISRTFLWGSSTPTSLWVTTIRVPHFPWIQHFKDWNVDLQGHPSKFSQLILQSCV